MQCLCNEHGHLIVEDSDQSGNGQPDTRVLRTFNDRGELTLQETDRALDGTIDERQAWQYTDGRLLVFSIDRDADTIADSFIYYTTNDDGLIISEDHDINADDAIEQRSFFSYDTHNNRIGQDVDFGVDDIIDRQCTYQPPCPPPYTLQACSDNLFCDSVPPPLPPIVERPTDNVYNVTLSALAIPHSELRSSEHTLVLFTIAEASAHDQPVADSPSLFCEQMRTVFSLRALISRFRVSTIRLRYLLVEVAPDMLHPRPDFLLEDILTYPTIVHLTADSDHEIVENRIQDCSARHLHALANALELNPPSLPKIP